VRIQTSLSLSSDDPQVLFNVAKAYDLLHEPRLATTYIQKALQKGQNRLTVEEDSHLQYLVLDSDVRTPIR